MVSNIIHLHKTIFISAAKALNLPPPNKSLNMLVSTDQCNHVKKSPSIVAVHTIAYVMWSPGGCHAQVALKPVAQVWEL